MSSHSVTSTEHGAVSRQAGRGASWILEASIGQNAIRLASSAILARILGPGAFGLFGIAYLAYDLIGRFSLSGMAGGVVAKATLDEKDLSTCFWGMNLFGMPIVGAAYFAAPLIALWVGDERATGVLRLVILVLFANCLAGVHRALLRKRLQFQTIAIIRTLAVAVESTSAVCLAFWGLDYWALAIGMVAGAFLENICMVLIVRWFPRWQFEKGSFLYFWRFGINGAGASILSYLSANVDYWSVAKLAGIKALGYYEFAYRLPHIIIERFAGPAGSVMFPAMAAIREDRSRVLEWYLRVTKSMALCVFPCFGGLFVVARPVVQVLWGDTWLSIVPLLQILCVGAALNSFWFLHRAVYLSQDRPDLTVKMGALSLIVAGTLVGYGGWRFGLTGIATGMTLARFTEIAWVWQALRLVDGRINIWLKALVAPVTGTLIMTIILLAIQIVANHNHLLSVPIVHLTVLVPLGVLIYVGIVRLFFQREFNELIEMVKLMLRRS